jgi:mycothiol synthase
MARWRGRLHPSLHVELSDIEIAVPDAPAISGLIFRHFRGQNDYAPMLSVLLSSEAADHIERSDTLESLVNNYQRLTNCDPYKDIIFAEIAGEMISYLRGWWSDDAVAGWSYDMLGFLVPAWRCKGIGGAMLHWMENHLRDRAAEHPTDKDRFYQTEVSQHQEGKRLMLEKASYQPVRYFFEMLRPTLNEIHVAPLPEGVEVRPALPEHYQAIWESVDETSRDEWGYAPPTHEDYHAWLNGPQFQPDLWQIAWDTATGKVAGHILTFIDHAQNEALDRKRGYTEGIGVDPDWRRRGLARALIARSLKAQRAAGMTESALIVDSENASGGTVLYESCGFQVVSWNAIYRKPLLLNT